MTSNSMAQQGPDRAREILLIDDHPLFCDALASVLERIASPETIRVAPSLEAGLAALSEGFQPDLITLDLNLPDASGLGGFARIRAHAPDTPILVISSESADATIGAALELGAAGFAPKSCAQATLDAALRAVLAGEKFTPPGYAPVPRDADDPAILSDAARRIAELTPQQERIMQLISKGKPNKQIAYELSLAEATVKAHVTALLRRLGVRNRTQVAILAREAGLQTGEG